jgi:hypothetical protein
MKIKQSERIRVTKDIRKIDFLKWDKGNLCKVLILSSNFN